jgi:hypothetical protein
VNNRNTKREQQKHEKGTTEARTGHSRGTNRAQQRQEQEINTRESYDLFESVDTVMEN